MQKLQVIGWLFATATAILLSVDPLLPYSSGSVPIPSPLESRPLQLPLLTQIEPTAIDDDPVPIETPPPSATEAYPAAQPSPAPGDTVLPYPAGTVAPENSPLPFSTIGEEIEMTAAPEAAFTNQPASTRQTLRGRLLLWGGFIVSLLLFATSVAGAIVLFMRRSG